MIITSEKIKKKKIIKKEFKNVLFDNNEQIFIYFLVKYLFIFTYLYRRYKFYF